MPLRSVVPAALGARARTALLSVALALAACRDAPPATTAPSGAAARPSPSVTAVPACPADVAALVASVVNALDPNVRPDAARLVAPIVERIVAGIAALGSAAPGDRPAVVEQIRQDALALYGVLRNAGASEQTVRGVIDAILSCLGDATTPGAPPTTSKLILPTDQPQTIVNSSPGGTGGVALGGNPVTAPSVLTIALIPPAGYPAPGTGPLVTRLDQYPGFFQVDLSGGTLTPGTRATVAICTPTSIPATIRDRLRLGHQASGGFEITPLPSSSTLLASLNCDGTAQLSLGARALRRLADALLPRAAYADVSERFGGVTGTTIEFSPFGAVDPDLRFGGVTGTTIEFQRRPLGPRFSIAAPPSCSAPINSEVPASCRPTVTVRTNLGTVLAGVPVAFAAGAGSGTVAPLVPPATSCVSAAFAPTITFATAADGSATACWRLGPTAGAQTVTATPQAGGDAPNGVTFTPSSGTFTITAIGPQLVLQPATVSLSGTPLLSVYILSSASFDAATVTPANVRALVNGGATEVLPNARAGVVSSSLADVNGDGRPDRLIGFRLADLRAAGFTASANTIVLRDRLSATPWSSAPATPTTVVP